mmetsp:Transcript_24101/g.90941  ORF Transcript_24101/g.90941 Transcript_24101/m.90941 type:complete len:265 (-) Transcript_24101:114-908(-)
MQRGAHPSFQASRSAGARLDRGPQPGPPPGRARAGPERVAPSSSHHQAGGTATKGDRRARAYVIARACGVHGPATKGRPGLAMADFSQAICSAVSPSTDVWSMPTVVSTAARGASTTLVLSSRPPRPASRMAMSTFSSSKCRMASPVTRSKNVAGLPSASSTRSTASRPAMTPCSEIGTPLIRTRSLAEERCGEVNSPVRSPAASHALASFQLTLPLPFVPATWITGTARCGLSSPAMRLRVFLSPCLTRRNRFAEYKRCSAAE